MHASPLVSLLVFSLLALAPTLRAAPSTQHFAVTGLARPVEILVDSWTRSLRRLA